jgi:hypothetical protein
MNDESVEVYNLMQKKIDTLDLTIAKLQCEIREKDVLINKLSEAKTNASYIFWIGELTGCFAGFYGYFIGNPFYIIIGIGIFLTAVTALIEVARMQEVE